MAMERCLKQSFLTMAQMHGAPAVPAVAGDARGTSHRAPENMKQAVECAIKLYQLLRSARPASIASAFRILDEAIEAQCQKV